MDDDTRPIERGGHSNDVKEEEEQERDSTNPQAEML